ncbi:MAG: sigma-54 dependent transcriptional regulator [Planctomycetota bacterium]|nr:sigma-54 dependent transcriptional regulator [Planctomycetota bacterium]
MAKILVVDDEHAICWAFSRALSRDGHIVSAASSAEEGLQKARAESPELVFLDVRLPGMSGLEALPKFREAIPGVPIVVLTAHGTMETAIEAVRRGAYEYLLKPIELEALRAVVSRALSRPDASPEIASLRREFQGRMLVDAMVGASPAMQEVYKKIGAVAPSDSSVLISGESGVGKELVAKAIHLYSPRADGPFLAVNCASLPETLLESELYGHVKGAFTGAVRDKAGKAEAADGGTLFLDEIGDMPPSMQAKLLRFLEEKKVTKVGATESVVVDVRILAATNQDLLGKMRDGLFREDLYYRLNVVSIEVPPLRERKEDIPLLVAAFLSRAGSRSGTEAAGKGGTGAGTGRSVAGGAGEIGIGEAAMKVLMEYDWPGNVRELRNAVEHAAVLARGRTILPEHLPPHILASMRGGAPRPGVSFEDAVLERTARAIREAEAAGEGRIYGEMLAEFERAMIGRVLREVGGNQVRASRLLGMHRTTLRKKIEEYGL